MSTEQGHFGHSKCSFQLEKEIMLEYTIIYLTNLEYLIKVVKKYMANILYCLKFQSTQILLKIQKTLFQGERDVGLICPIYNVNSGKFEGLYKALGEMIVTADQKEVFLDYGFLKAL